MYRLVLERLPDVTMVGIARKPSVARFHNRRVELNPERRRIGAAALAPTAAGA